MCLNYSRYACVRTLKYLFVWFSIYIEMQSPLNFFCFFVLRKLILSNHVNSRLRKLSIKPGTNRPVTYLCRFYRYWKVPFTRLSWTRPCPSCFVYDGEKLVSGGKWLLDTRGHLYQLWCRRGSNDYFFLHTVTLTNNNRRVY